jgi:hypothetical protein
MTKAKKIEAPKLPASHLEAIDAAGFEVLRYSSRSTRVVCSDGSERNEWLPEDIVNWGSRRFIRWCVDSKYDFAGWEPQDGHSFGGRYDTVAGALGWFTWKDAQK